jgi:DNA-directed RNA polymerase subunit RPC12/RpoP
MKRLFWPVVAFGLLLAALGVVPLPYVGAPLLGLFIYRAGVASLASLRRGASFVPEGPPQPVDVRAERTVYWCAGCGAEVLLIVRGAQVPPRHCGERMSERREVARQLG